MEPTGQAADIAGPSQRRQDHEPLIAAAQGLVATYSSSYSWSEWTEIVAWLELPPDDIGPEAANRLPKVSMWGVCGNLFGNQFDFAGNPVRAPKATKAALGR